MEFTLQIVLTAVICRILKVFSRMRLPSGVCSADGMFEVKKAQLAQSLVRLRISQGLSQESLAYEAEVERSYVSLIERGQSNPSLRVLCQLAQRLGVSVMTLLGEAEPLDRMPDTGSTALVLHDPGRSMVFEETRPNTPG